MLSLNKVAVAPSGCSLSQGRSKERTVEGTEDVVFETRYRVAGQLQDPGRPPPLRHLRVDPEVEAYHHAHGARGTGNDDMAVYITFDKHYRRTRTFRVKKVSG